MERMLLTIAICGFPALIIAQEQGIASDNSRQFKCSDEIIVIATEQGKTVRMMKTKVVGTLPNGFLKIYGEKTMNLNQSIWKVTFSSIVRTTDITQEGTVHSKYLRNTSIVKREVDEDKEKIRQNRGRNLKYDNIIPASKQDSILNCRRSTSHKHRFQRKHFYRHLRCHETKQRQHRSRW